MAQEFQYQWTDNPTISGISPCNTDILNDCLMHLMYDKKSGSGFNLFDTKLSDYILQGEEAEGWALQGTYVYKDAVAGSREGYPDFYAKCLQEYQNGANVAGVSIPLPTFTSNTTDGITVSDARGNTDAYTIINGKIASGSGNSKQIGTWSTYWFNIDYSRKTIIKSYTIQADNNGEPEYPTAWTLQGSNDGEVFEIIDTQSGVTFSLAQSRTFNVDTDKIYSQYRLVFSSGVEASNDGEFGKLSFDVGVPVIQNANGHQFYDIAQKDRIDEQFATTGMAWLYGVDTENERIFLPRNNWFEQATDNGSEVGQSVEAGLPNITGQSSALRGCDYIAGGTGALYSTAVGNGAQAGVNTNVPVLNFDASRSNPIYSNSDTVQPNAVKKLLYICVGNTEVTSAVTDVTEVTTTENDTLPLFAPMYFDFTPNNVSWLKAGQQHNNAGIYSFAYSELVKELTLPKYGLKVINEADMVSGVDYSLYWKVNQTNMTFTTPTAISNKALSGAVKGNGMTLGLTDGDNNKGLYETPSNVLTGAINLIGTNIGTSGGSDSFKDNVGIGVTTDSSKSGIIAEQATAQLYFKVANAVQNLELLDAGAVLETLSNKVDINSKVIDGQPVIVNQVVYNSTSSGTVDLSTIIPNDGNVYECNFFAKVSKNSASGYMLGHYTMNGQEAEAQGAGDLWNNYQNFTFYTNTNDRILEVSTTTNATWSEHSVKLQSYRRVGTNA